MTSSMLTTAVVMLCWMWGSFLWSQVELLWMACSEAMPIPDEMKVSEVQTSMIWHLSNKVCPPGVPSSCLFGWYFTELTAFPWTEGVSWCLPAKGLWSCIECTYWFFERCCVGRQLTDLLVFALSFEYAEADGVWLLFLWVWSYQDMFPRLSYRTKIKLFLKAQSQSLGMQSRR